jgi:CBS domain-containing protein
MTRKTFVASPIVFIEETQTVRDCIRLMAKNQIGAMIVLSSGPSREPVGIFTERDLVRHSEQLIDGSWWDRHIRFFMSSPLRTVDVSEIDRAGEIMLSGGTRHLPVSLEVQSKKVIVGMISMRDVFRELVLARRESTTVQAGASGSVHSSLVRQEFKVAICSGDPAVGGLISGMIGKKFNLSLALLSQDRLFFGEETGALDGCDLAMVDLDGVASAQWMRWFARYSEIKNRPHTFFLLDPLKHPEIQGEQLALLSGLEHATVFSKPLAIGRLINRIHSLIQRQQLSG